MLNLKLIYYYAHHSYKFIVKHDCNYDHHYHYDYHYDYDFYHYDNDIHINYRILIQFHIDTDSQFYIDSI